MRAASAKIRPPQYFEILTKRDGRIRHIIDEIEAALREGVSVQLQDFAKDFPPTEHGLRRLWWWVKTNIKYSEDSEAAQVVQEPARLNVTRKGDCKSFSLFIASVLACHRVPFSLMYVHYSDTGSNHVYPVAHTKGGDIICDAVWTHFDSQKEPFKVIRQQLYKF
jgi:predicted transglutaminase-like cysteine proteinase